MTQQQVFKFLDFISLARVRGRISKNITTADNVHGSAVGGGGLIPYPCRRQTNFFAAFNIARGTDDRVAPASNFTFQLHQDLHSQSHLDPDATVNQRSF